MLPVEEEDTLKEKDSSIKAAENGLNKGKGMAYHLYLYAKDPLTWDITDGAWGKLNILATGKFVFNAHGLEPGKEYYLINYAPNTDWSEYPYPNPWPGDGSLILATGIVGDDGSLHLKSDSPEVEGKVWLVSSSDFSEGSMTAWNPTDYLFEFNLLPKLTIRHTMNVK